MLFSLPKMTPPSPLAKLSTKATPATPEKKEIVKFIGKKVWNYSGFTVHEICSRLRQFGVGRVISRKSAWDRLPHESKFFFQF